VSHFDEIAEKARRHAGLSELPAQMQRRLAEMRGPSAARLQLKTVRKLLRLRLLVARLPDQTSARFVDLLLQTSVRRQDVRFRIQQRRRRPRDRRISSRLRQLRERRNELIETKA